METHILSPSISQDHAPEHHEDYLHRAAAAILRASEGLETLSDEQVAAYLTKHTVLLNGVAYCQNLVTPEAIVEAKALKDHPAVVSHGVELKRRGVTGLG